MTQPAEHRAGAAKVRGPAVRAGLVAVLTAAAAVASVVADVPWWTVVVGVLAFGMSLLEWWFRRTTRCVIDVEAGEVRLHHPYRTATFPIEGLRVRARKLGAGEWLWWFEHPELRRAWLPTWDGHDELAGALRSAGIPLEGR